MSKMTGTPPRIALLVHNRLESDPRVSRHVSTIVGMGYRAAVLCAGVQAGRRGYVWGTRIDGAEVYESGPRPTLLGRVRGWILHLPVGRRPPPRDAGPSPRGRASGPQTDAAPAGSAPRVLGMARDLWDFGRLLYWNLTIFRQFRSVGAGVVHANDLNVLPAGYLLAKAWRAPLLYDSHELWVEQDTDWSPFFRRLQGWLERLLVRRSNAVITVNGAIAEELAARYGIPRPEVVMNCPAAPDDLTVGPLIARQGSLRAIYQGALAPNRGLIEVIDAVAATPGVNLVLRGPGNARAELETRVADLGVGERVSVLDPVPMAGMVPALRGFAVGLVPILPKGKSYELCSPNKLFEYMSAGLAVICSDLPVLREIVVETGCGLLVAPGDREAIASALRRLAADPELLLTLRTRALVAARDSYNSRIEQVKLQAVYARLIEGRQSPRMSELPRMDDHTCAG